MALNTSGQISLAGPVSGESIALTINQSATGQISLNDTNVRTLSGVTTPNSQIVMPTNFYGKAWNAAVAEFFMMGGGGVGGNSGAGGGQMVGKDTGTLVSVTAGVTYTVTVGGAGSASSVFGTTAIAGGSGGFNSSGYSGGTAGGNGACGGGGGTNCASAAFSGGTGSYGFNGGSGAYASTISAAGGGGGGLGSAGGNASASSSADYGGNGGGSLTSTFNPTGTAINYGGGSPGRCGFCGSGEPCTNGSFANSYYGANTGYGNYSGVVIIRVSNSVLTPTTTGSPTFVNSGGYFWYTFTGSGTIKF